MRAHERRALHAICDLVRLGGVPVNEAARQLELSDGLVRMWRYRRRAEWDEAIADAIAEHDERVARVAEQLRPRL